MCTNVDETVCDIDACTDIFSVEDIEDCEMHEAIKIIQQYLNNQETSSGVTQSCEGILLYTGLGSERIERHTDTFAAGSYCCETDSKMIANGPGGYVY